VNVWIALWIAAIFPVCLKMSIIKTLYKKGDKTGTTNYNNNYILFFERASEGRA
jgi:hypothetical protein